MGAEPTGERKVIYYAQGCPEGVEVELQLNGIPSYREIVRQCTRRALAGSMAGASSARGESERKSSRAFLAECY